MKKNIILKFLILVSCITMLFTAYDRIKVESDNKGVEIILDYEEVKELAKQSDKELEWWLKKFRQMGVTSVAITEETLKSLEEDNPDLQVEVVENIMNNQNWQKEYPESLVRYINDEKADKYDLVVLTGSKRVFDFIKKGLEERYPSDFYKILNDGKYTFIIDGSREEALYTQPLDIRDVYGKTVDRDMQLVTSKVINIGLGFDEEKVNIIKSSGLKVIPRPENYARYSENLVNAYINAMEELNINPSVMIFSGGEVLGFKNGQDELVRYMKNKNIRVGLVETAVQREHLEQEGIDELTKALNYNSVRIFTVWPYIQERYKYYNYEGAEEIENSLYRAITERNIRIIYFKPFKEDKFKYVTDIQEYERTFTSLKERLQRHNIYIGNFTVMKSYNVSLLRLSLLGIGIAAAGIVLLSFFIPIKGKIENVLILLGILAVIGLVYFVPSIGDKLLALGASIVFPSISFIYLIKKVKKIVLTYKKDANISKVILNSIAALLICSFISFIGGLFVATILSDIKYLLEIDIFKGVKISQLLPIALFICIYLAEFGFDRNENELSDSRISLEEINKLLNWNIKLKYIIFAGILLIAGYVYIARTGHETSIKPSDMEMIARNFLENTLLARPRTKEFLIAFPSLMLCIYAAYDGWKKLILPLGVAAVIGQTSIINTFSHIRTPLYLSIVRTMYSLAFGIVIGVVLIIAIRGLSKFFFPLKGEKENE